ncbi:suppressor of fused domain protein [Clostridium sp. KNHs205]|jgi:antitoxin YqcF|uniref:suppressor of fused domain protein n=1 Tax=Clostridium sp. KNHs205 TaxID=1449050 RepID=UPI00051B098A|nr:suppressor of fused domain protein [Clostridium sp. KNHs205]
MGISNENKVIAKSALQAFGGKPNVSKYWDDVNVSSVDLLTAVRPDEDIVSYSTIGLSDHSIDYNIDGTPLRVEIVGACAAKFNQYPNLLATCAFYIINSKFSVSHGKIFRDIIEMYFPDSQMKHVLFVAPFLWGDIKTLEFPDKKVAWLLAVPISENEYLFAQEKGTEMLEKLFEQKKIQIFDIERKSIL